MILKANFLNVGQRYAFAQPTSGVSGQTLAHAWVDLACGDHQEESGKQRLDRYNRLRWRHPLVGYRFGADLFYANTDCFTDQVRVLAAVRGGSPALEADRPTPDAGQRPES